jgi:hypothetical protein
MLMWSHKKISPKEYVRHMKRLMGTKDVMFSKHDLLPSLMQPFLLTSYYEICRERKMDIPTMFQWDVVWEPTGEHMKRVQKMLEDENQNEKGAVGKHDENAFDMNTST